MLSSELITDLFPASIGLIGTIIGAFITLLISKRDTQKQIRQYIATKEGEIRDTQIEQKRDYIEKLVADHQMCNQIGAYLVQVLWFCNAETSSQYEKAGVYPAISAAFLDTPRSQLSSDLNDQLSALYVQISIYNELIRNPQNKQDQIRCVLAEIFKRARIAQSTCFEYSRAFSYEKIQQEERALIELKIEKLKRYKESVL